LSKSQRDRQAGRKTPRMRTRERKQNNISTLGSEEVMIHIHINKYIFIEYKQYIYIYIYKKKKKKYI